jgi:TRAP-type C4-dicarboxylate transport system substrate-binding protein
MVANSGGRGVRAAALAVGACSVLALSACADTQGSGAGGGGGKGVPAGATIEQYKAAFADVEPIKLTTQSPSPKGSVTGKNVEDYLKAVTEWSGGKITFEVTYSNGVAPPAEVDDALVDGRLDIGQVLPIYEPSEYPANAALIQASFVSNQTPVAGTMQSNAWPNEVAFKTPEITKEFEKKGIKLMVPYYDSGANVMFCRKPRRDLAALKGVQTASGGQAQNTELTALGAAPASVPYTEQFESLQRGVVDCTVSSFTVGVLGGFVKVAPNVTIDPAAGFALAPGGMAINQRTWDGLPLVARQLLWDRLDVFLAANIEGKIWPNIAQAVSEAKAAGGSVGPFAEDARKAMTAANTRMLNELRTEAKVEDPGAFVANIQSAADRWLKEAQAAGPQEDVAHADFDKWYKPGKVDVDRYIDKVYQQVFLPHRPS